MKKLIYTITLIIFLASCSKWLDVKPSTQVEKRDLLSTTEGYREVLIGAYIRLKSNDLYGKNLSWSTIELLAQHWEYASKTTDEDVSLYRYDYDNVSNIMGNIYNSLYKTIADVNSILESIDQHKDIFSDGNYELIKGEALAIRAYCHLDLLRLFGPIPTSDTQDDILPYVKTVGNVPNVHIPYSEYTNSLKEDLNQAENYLKKIDPITTYSIDELNSFYKGDFKPYDTFWAYRQMRFNYYSVIATKARFYLWIGEKQEALKNAEIVINATDKSGKKQYTLGNKSDMDRKDYSLSSEHILSFNNHNMSTLKKSLTYYRYDRKLLELFDNNDIRYTKLWEEDFDGTTRVYKTRKYTQLESYTNINKWAQNSMPVIRLYEMYLIAIECSDNAKAISLWNIISESRDTEPINQIVDKSAFNKLIVKEYNREFYAEGQAFYAYKRLNIEDILWSSKSGGKDVYVIPQPKEEFNYIK